MDYLKEFNSLLQNLDRSKSVATVFDDFLSLATLSLAQPFYRSNQLERQYLEIVGRYTKEQANEFSQMLALIVLALDEKHQDFLGQVFSASNFGNARKGQFFTPYHVSKLMAQINFTDIENQLAEKDFVTLAEPCCGSGGIIIAYVETMKNHNINFQHKLFVEAIDIDELCFQMAYLQLSLYGIPAKVMLGDTLAYKFSQIIYTPMYFINGFSWRLKEIERAKTKSEQEIIQEIVEIKQLSLF